MKLLLPLIAICLTSLCASIIPERIDCNNNLEINDLNKFDFKLFEVDLDLKTHSSIIDYASSPGNSSSGLSVLRYNFFTISSSMHLPIGELQEFISLSILQIKSTVITT